MEDMWFNIKYYLWHRPKDFYHDVKWFLKNLWVFRKQMWKFRPWDFYHNFQLFAFSLELLSNQIRNGVEEERSATKKSDAIDELVGLMKTLSEDDFEMYEEYSNGDKFIITPAKYNNEYKKRRNKALKRIFRIIKGQDDKEFEGIDLTSSEEHYDKWVEKFDGTGYYGWWE